jgi:hypothetical protein
MFDHEEPNDIYYLLPILGHVGSEVLGTQGLDMFVTSLTLEYVVCGYLKFTRSYPPLNIYICMCIYIYMIIYA